MNTDTYGSSVWNQGAAAARAGLLSIHCPYHRLSYDFVVWHNGWSWASHVKAKEDFDL